MKAVGVFRSTHSESELLQTLSRVQNPDERASQVLMASKSILDIDERQNILALLFEQQFSATHIPLMVDLYVKATQTNDPASVMLATRVLITNWSLETRLMYDLGRILHLPLPFKTIKPGEPLPRLLQLLESARNSPSLSVVEHKMVEDAINFVKDSMAENKGLKNVTSIYGTVPFEPSSGQTTGAGSAKSETTRAPEPKPMAVSPKSEPSAVPRSYIALPLLAVVSLLWWWHHRKK